MLEIEKPASTWCFLLKVGDCDDLVTRLMQLKQKRVEISVTNDDRHITVTMEKWDKYQGDNSLLRTREWRKRKKSVTEHISSLSLSNSINKKKDRAKYSEAFLRFWTAYPNKTSKEAAWKAWQKNKCDSLIEKILTAIAEQIKSPKWTKDNGDYIPNPATWLNGHQWENEIVVVKQDRTSSLDRIRAEIKELERDRAGYTKV